MRRIIAAIAASLLITFGVVAVTGTPAQAACSYQCVHMYANANYGGTNSWWDINASNTCRSLSGYTLNNNIESIYGNYVGTGKYVSYWNSHNCTGTVLWWSSGGAYPTLPTSVRNVISSFRICTGPC